MPVPFIPRAGEFCAREPRAARLSARRMLTLLGATALATATVSAAVAQVAVSSIATNPDGSTTQALTSGGTTTYTIRQPDGSTARLDRNGNITDLSLACQNVTSIDPRHGSKDAHAVCVSTPKGPMVYEVTWLNYTCYDPSNNKPGQNFTVHKRFSLGWINTGQPCDPASETFDRLTAQTDFGEQWQYYPPQTASQSPPTGAGQPTGSDQPPSGGAAPPTGGDQPPTGDNQPPPGASPPPGTNTPTGGSTPPSGGDNQATDQPKPAGEPIPNGKADGFVPAGWPPGADWVRFSNGFKIIHYTDGRTIAIPESASAESAPAPGGTEAGPPQPPNSSTSTPPNTSGQSSSGPLSKALSYTAGPGQLPKLGHVKRRPHDYVYGGQSVVSEPSGLGRLKQHRYSRFMQMNHAGAYAEMARAYFFGGQPATGPYAAYGQNMGAGPAPEQDEFYLQSRFDNRRGGNSHGRD